MFITKCYPTIKHLPLNLLKILFLLIDFCAMGAPMEGFQYSLKLRDKNKTKKTKKRMNSFEEEKHLDPPYFQTLYLLHFSLF